MSTHKNVRHADDARGHFMNKVARPNEAYYVLLAERLQSLLKDMEAAGTPVDDDLVRRLRTLLDEARRQIASGN